MTAVIWSRATIAEMQMNFVSGHVSLFSCNILKIQLEVKVILTGSQGSTVILDDSAEQDVV